MNEHRLRSTCQKTGIINLFGYSGIWCICSEHIVDYTCGMPAIKLGYIVYVILLLFCQQLYQINSLSMLEINSI